MDLRSMMLKRKKKTKGGEEKEKQAVGNSQMLNARGLKTRQSRVKR